MGWLGVGAALAIVVSAIYLCADDFEPGMCTSVMSICKRSLFMCVWLLYVYVFASYTQFSLSFVIYLMDCLCVILMVLLRRQCTSQTRAHHRCVGGNRRADGIPLRPSRRQRRRHSAHRTPSTTGASRATLSHDSTRCTSYVGGLG